MARVVIDAVGCLLKIIRDLEMLMLQKPLLSREGVGDEAFGADPVGGVPDQEERMLDVWSRLGSDARMQAHAARPRHG
jgi:hypothetical protein